jgi:molybdate/tungstate transport system permease protein
MNMKNINYTTIFFALMGSFLFLFTFIPIANLIISSDPGSFIRNLDDQGVRSAFFTSMYCALASTILATISGVPLAYILARHDFKWKGFVESVVDVPLVIPPTVSGIFLLMVFTSTGIFGEPLSKIGITFTDAIPGIIVAMLFTSANYVVNSSREAFEKVDPRMEKVARTLGSGPFRTFFVITLPLSLRSIVVGGIMAWGRGISQFGAVLIIAYHPITAPLLIYERFINFGLVEAISVATLLITISLIVFIVVRLLISGWKTYDND